MPSIVLVSRELHPLGGGGIGVQVLGTAAALAHMADVTLLTSSAHEESYRRLVRENPTAFPANVAVEFVPEPEPEEAADYLGFMHLYSARVYARLRELFPGGGPDLVEFPDYLAEGLVTLQARRADDPSIRSSLLCVRLHTSAEMCSVLDGYVGEEFETRVVFESERYCLRHADRLLWAGGDVLDTYRRYYGDGALATAVRIHHVAPPRSESPDVPDPPDISDRFDMVYAGRLERRKGVAELVRAALTIPWEGWRLTLVGGDTDTAPLGGSMREHLELAVSGDPRVEFLGPVPRDRLPELIGRHHLAVCPSRWECWPYSVLEALEHNRPVLGTPTGGLVELLGDPAAGWLSEGRDAGSLARVLDRLMDARQGVAELIETGGPRRAYERLTDVPSFQDAYAALLAESPEGRDRRPATATKPAPLVSVVIPYFRLDAFVEDTIRSVFDQDHRRLEVILVNDGSFRAEDRLLGRLAVKYPIRILTEANSGLGAARNAGIAHSRGRYVLPLDADNMLRPTFVSRCVELLENQPSVAFVTTWVTYIDENGTARGDRGFYPLGNETELVLEGNVAGDAAAVIRKRFFDVGYSYSRELTSFEDWQLYRELHLSGHFGRVIPERLLLYRVRADSMLREIGLERTGRLAGEMTARLREGQIEWVSRNV